MGYGKKYRSVSEKVDVNMDYELDNVLIDYDGPIFIDWQSPMISHPGCL